MIRFEWQNWSERTTNNECANKSVFSLRKKVPCDLLVVFGNAYEMWYFFSFFLSLSILIGFGNYYSNILRSFNCAHITCSKWWNIFVSSRTDTIAHNNDINAYTIGRVRKWMFARRFTCRLRAHVLAIGDLKQNHCMIGDLKLPT